MMPSYTEVYREEDPQARLAALEHEHHDVAEDLERAREEIANLRLPWSWRQFLLGLALLPGALWIAVEIVRQL